MKKQISTRTKKILSLVLAFAMLLSMVTISGMTASADETSAQIWDGWTTTAPVDSDDDGIYEINNSAELAYAIKNGGQGKSYVLTADIYFNDITKVNWLTGAVATGYTANTWYGDWNVTAFTGTIDGAGHTVHGLYYEMQDGKSYTSYCGGIALIPKASNVTVKNLGIDNSYLHQEASVSAFVAAAPASSVVNLDSCYVGENVYLKAYTVGALRGFASNAGGGTFVNCYSLANMNAMGGDSGLLGFNWDNKAGAITIKNCYNAKGAVSTMGDTGYYADMQGNYETAVSAFSEGNTLLTTDDMQGEAALVNMGTLNNFGNYYVATETYPVLSVFKGIKVNEYWNGTTVQPTEVDDKGNILINNGKELAWVISNGGAADATYKLTSDIYLNNPDKINWSTGVADSGYAPNVWYNNTAFQGTIDGAGHVIYGIYYEPVGSYAFGFNGRGLIPRVNLGCSVTVKNLGIDKSYIDGANGASAFVGFAGNTGGGDETEVAANRANVTIDQCYVGENVVIKGGDAGAFRGATFGSNTTITNSYSLATLVGSERSGLFCNTWNVTVKVQNCFNAKGAVTTEVYGWTNVGQNFNNVYVTDSANFPSETILRTSDNMKGLDVFTNEEKMPGLNSTGKFFATEGYPLPIAFLGYEIEVGEEVWDGTTSAPTANSEGVYEIGTAEELAYIIENGGAAGANYKLTSDIYLNATQYIDWETGAVTVGYSPNVWYNNVAFQGNIDGNGFTVHGLYYNQTGDVKWGYQGVGLVPRVNDGTSVTIKNLAVDNSYICSTNGVSAFVGITAPAYNNTESAYANLKISHCYAGENVTLKGNHAGVFRGGSYRANTTIENCYTLATTITLAAKDGAAGIFGNEWTSKVVVKNVFNVNGGVGGQEYALVNKTLSGVFVTTDIAGDGKTYSHDVIKVLTAKNMQGRDALDNTAKLYGLNSDNAFEATTGYPILVAFIKDFVGEDTETDTIAIWNGSDVEPTQTDANGNILITSAEELAYIIENGGADGATYKLTTNIYLNDIDKIDWTTGEAIAGYIPNNWYENVAFQGTIDGDGYIVYGLYSVIPDAEYGWGYWGQGLIPRVDCGVTVTIKNLGVDNAYINAVNAAGAFVGFAGTRNSDSYTETANVNIDQCFVGESVSLNAHSAGAFVGGGRGTVIDINKSYSLAEINSCEMGSVAVDFAPSGFIGNDWDVAFTVNNSYNANGTFQGWWDNTTYQNSKNNYATGYNIDKTANGGELEAYYATRLSNADMKGFDALVSDTKMWKLGASGAYVATEGYPELKVFVNKGNGYSNTGLRVWDGSKTAPTYGSGTEAEPYLIGYASELAYIIYNGGAANTYYKLTNDIYLNNIYMIDWATGEAAEGYTPNTWFENLPFQGNIDGDGHIVYGLYYNDGADLASFGYYYNSALIPRVNDNTSVSIKNLGIDNAFVHAAQGASAFVGFAGATGNYAPTVKAEVVIDNCYAGAKVYLEGGNTGVFRGGERGSNTVVSNSYSLANTIGNGYNGLLGNFWSATASVTNVYNANGPVATDSAASVTTTNVYATEESAAVVNVSVITRDEMLGETALDNMSGLDTDVFKAAYNYYPILKAFVNNKLIKNNRLYYGVAINDAIDFYATESGEQYFWRYDNILVNNDSTMDIADLVFLMLQFQEGTCVADIDGDGQNTSDDLKVLRKALIGKTDYIDSPMNSVGNYTPVTTTLSSDYVYVWGDEFDGESLNTQKWGIYGKMNGSSGEYEGDVVCKSDETAIGVGDGNLRLTAYKTDEGKYVVPTSVVTQNTMNFKYGYVEIRAKFPVQDGIWSSWWTKSVFDRSDTYNLAYPETNLGAEIDMIEVFDTDQATFNIIKWWEKEDGTFGSWYPNDAPDAKKQTITNDRYYVFGYEWTEDEVIMYCDGVEYGRYDISEAYTEKVPGRNKFADTSGTGMEGFDAHQFIIFNNHLFYPTISDAGIFITENEDFTQADFLIDYCRVYQKAGYGDIITK